MKKKSSVPKHSAKVTKMKKTPLQPPRALPLLPVMPELSIIAICMGLYYAMIHFYLFFPWGIYLYYAMKAIVAFAILSAARRSVWVPVVALAWGLSSLLTNSLYLNPLMSTASAWQLSIIAAIGIALSIFVRKRT